MAEINVSIDIDYDKLAKLIAENMYRMQQEEQTKVRTRIDGIRGLAKYLRCSPSHAQALKNDKKVPFYTHGNRVFFYSDEVDNSLKTTPNH